MNFWIFSIEMSQETFSLSIAPDEKICHIFDEIWFIFENLISSFHSSSSHRFEFFHFFVWCFVYPRVDIETWTSLRVGCWVIVSLQHKLWVKSFERFYEQEFIYDNFNLKVIADYLSKIFEKWSEISHTNSFKFSIILTS